MTTSQTCANLKATIEALTIAIDRDSKLALNDASVRERLATAKANLQSVQKSYDSLNCANAIAEIKAEKTIDIVGKFTDLDKERIESESKNERNKRIFFGTIILIAGMVLVVSFTNKK